MLYNESTGKPKVQADVFSLEALVEWLEKQPANGSYDWECTTGGCLIGLYAADTSVDFFRCHSAFYVRDELHVASHQPHTFGAALSRARKALAA